ncbi:MAG: FHA domain-containing protein [Capsulimonadaceae bacterium]
MKNYYAILEVNQHSSAAEIRESYRRLVQRHLWNREASAELKEAYDALTTPARREEYDRAAVAEGITTVTGGEVRMEAPAAEAGRRCPMGAASQCPVLAVRFSAGMTHCPECGLELASVPQLMSGREENMEQNWFGRLEEETGRKHRLHTGESTVGREAADITLPDKTVSRLHARLQSGEDKVVILEDLGSTNGTQVNGERMTPHTPRTLVDGDTVRFGSIRLRYRALDALTEGTEVDLPDPEPIDMPVVPLVAPQEPVLASEPSFGSFLDQPIAQPQAMNPLERLFRAPLGTAVNARARLIATRGDMISEHPLIEGVTSFGRRADCTIVLRNDPYVSGTHAQIVGEGEAFHLIDVGSTNGTLLNGERLVPNHPVTLSRGDEVVIGGTIFRFEPNDSVRDGSLR